MFFWKQYNGSAKNKEKGFTFIELLVAMSVFAIIITSIAGTFAAVINAHRKAVAIQNTEEAGRYILEMMGKEIRMGTINTGNPGGVTTVSTMNITNSQPDTFDYQFTNNKLTRKGADVSPSNVEISNGEFIIDKNSSPACTKVTIVMKIKSKGTKSSLESEMNLQTTMAVRQVQ